MNLTTCIPEKLTMGGLDDLVQMARSEAVLCPDARLSLHKEDFTGAFKTLPVHGDDLQFCAAVWHGSLRVDRALVLVSMAFGTVGSVFAWERFARAIQMILASAIKGLWGAVACASRTGAAILLRLEPVC